MREPRAARHVLVAARRSLLDLVTSDSLLPGQVDDHVAGDEVTGCVSGTRSVELNAEGP